MQRSGSAATRLLVGSVVAATAVAGLVAAPPVGADTVVPAVDVYMSTVGIVHGNDLDVVARGRGGAYRTLVSEPETSYDFGSGRVAVDHQGDVFYADGPLRELPAGSSTPRLVAPDLTLVYAVTVDLAGDLYVSRPSATLAHTTQVDVLPADGSPRRTLGTFSLSRGPSNLTVDAYGDVFALAGLNQVVEFPGGHGPAVPVSLGPSTELRSVAVGPTGDLYVLDVDAGTLRRVPADGAAEVTVATGLTDPQDVAVDAAGNAYVTEWTNGTGRLTELAAAGTRQVVRTVPDDGPGAVAVRRVSAPGLAVGGGDQQSAVSGQAFTRPPLTTVADAAGDPRPGVVVTFTVSGPARFAGGAASAGVTTGAGGTAVAPTLVATSGTGAVTVRATAAGVATAAVFHEDVVAYAPPRADLSVDVRGADRPSPGGGTVDYATVTIRNDGPDPSGPTLVALYLGPGVRLEFEHEGTVALPFWYEGVASLRPDTARSFLLYLVRSDTGPVAGNLVAVIGSGTADPRPSNNVAGEGLYALAALLPTLHLPPVVAAQLGPVVATVLPHG